MTHVDGNALAGMLEPLFAADPTRLRVECAHCGLRMLIAEAMVTFDSPGAVAHCPGCTGILLTLAEEDGGLVLGVRGIVRIATD
jgi:ribosomal protein S27E